MVDLVVTDCVFSCDICHFYNVRKCSAIDPRMCRLVRTTQILKPDGRMFNELYQAKCHYVFG